MVRPLARLASLAGPSRGFASTARAMAYPFSGNVAFPEPKAPSPLPQNLLTPKNGWHVVEHVNAGLRQEVDPEGLLKTLFARRSRDRLRTGSVVSVISYLKADRSGGVQPFSGVLMKVRRRGVDTSFTLRNIVAKTGIEMNFKVCSPMIKEIKIVRRAEGRSGPIKDLRRARATYLRERPDMMATIASALKQDQAQRVAAKRDSLSGGKKK
ncbi:hypothetical protein CspHIS471_0212370 [Cutaneotrichosporon sp. HIS471]|nr:hypothetical protein CspHIS471_0212370 [Cutaneotrichosporon sp. HIS471]